MADGPCLNPSCGSRGKPHPNCMCYGAYAEGGEVSHFCQQKQPHQPSCEYFMGDAESFAEGGPVDSGIIPYSNENPAPGNTETGSSDTGVIPYDLSNPEDLKAKLDSEAMADTAEQEKSGGIGNMLLSGLYSAAKTLHAPGEAATAQLGSKTVKLQPDAVISPERGKELEHANPISSSLGTIAGLLIPGGQGAALEKAGVMAAEKLVPKVVEEGVLRGVGRGAVKVAAESALYQAGDETSKMMTHDPNQSISSAISNIGLATVIGGGLGAVSPLWKATMGAKMGEVTSDFRARMREHLDIPEPTKTVYDPFIKKSREIPIGRPDDAKPLGETTGAKLADMFIKHSDNLEAKTLAGAIGGYAGHATGIPYGGAIGAYFGQRALGPILESVLPNIAKPIVEKMVSGEGLKAATVYGLDVAKGIKLTQDAVKNVFKAGAKTIPDRLDLENSRKKLEAGLVKLQQDPARLSGISGQLGHYLPDHAVAAGTTIQSITSFLNNLRPQDAPKAPLDTPKPISKAVQAQYDRALDIANKPLIVLDSVKDGTITSHDVIAMQQMYPQLYQGIKQRLMNHIVEHVSGENTVPYKVRLGLSIFMGQPLDSSMSPQAIMGAQPMSQQPPQQAQPGKKVSNGASGQMMKGAKAMQTSAQASEAMHSSGAKA